MSNHLLFAMVFQSKWILFKAEDEAIFLFVLITLYNHLEKGATHIVAGILLLAISVFRLRRALFVLTASSRVRKSEASA